MRRIGRRTILQVGVGAALTAIATQYTARAQAPTGKIFISAGRGGFEGALRNPGAEVGGTNEAIEMIATRDLIVAELRSRGLAVEAPDDTLNSVSTIEWINARGNMQDVALEIRMGAVDNLDIRGATAFYIALNGDRRRQAEQLLSALVKRVPLLLSRGVKPDTEASLGRLAFCRDLIPQSLLVELGFLTNSQDRSLLQTRRRDFALGLADGLEKWLRSIDALQNNPTVVTPTIEPEETSQDSSTTNPSTLPPDRTFQQASRRASSDGSSEPDDLPIVTIQINGQIQPQRGIILFGNAYIPELQLELLGLTVQKTANIRRIVYRKTVYVQAIALRDLSISISFDSLRRMVILKTVLKACSGQIDRIMESGNTSEAQLLTFLKINQVPIAKYGELPKIYREEAAIEGVNHDIAFCQMCLETNFLQFGGDILPEQNNFGGLGVVGGGLHGDRFPDQRTGVRAQIQRLKAYASTAPLVLAVVDPRFPYITRGTAPLLGQLTDRWSLDPNYDRRIMAIIRRLYESAGIL
ncbi:N-acetylmuramoyl-L-alanine amidase [Tumidithrix elongata RA019]|uniref:N-acetylmuramoyl-L-alanine amidase n=1 Tax=Tumidithrix elongata BACA0141 TaxID=2716417 RepID=A0AAW9Q3B9_9CYAN|nr:N-acetylmuramoyl-L-alanine amidase [Tumidithrix elongata RA019]